MFLSPALSLFTAGSLLCSIAWDTTSLILFRIIQAVGAGPLVVVAMSIMFEAFPRRERGLAMGLLMTGWSIGPFFGPLLGGYLVQYVHWRAIFYVNIPVGLLSIAAAYVLLPKSRGKGSIPFDLPGFIILTGGGRLAPPNIESSSGMGLGESTGDIVSRRVRHPVVPLCGCRAPDDASIRGITAFPERQLHPLEHHHLF